MRLAQLSMIENRHPVKRFRHFDVARALPNEARRSIGDEMAQDRSNDGNRSKYRDNDDVREPLSGNQRSDTKSDSKSEARGDARDNIGNTARGTAASPTGSEGNDRTREGPQADGFHEDLKDT
jgi:hypothetical protein